MSGIARARLLTYQARSRLGFTVDPRRPSRTLFSGIRRRLTLWYSGVLAAALLLSGLVLYLAVQDSLLSPMNSVLKVDATQSIALLWQQNWASEDATGLFDGACPQGAGDVDPNLLIACFDPHGVLEGENPIVRDPRLAAFTSPSLARSVIGGGSAGDTIATDAVGEFASVQRYAMSVPSPTGHGSLGVLVVGLPVGGQAAALSTMLHLLLFLGALTVLISLGGGLFLANRALQPARLAYARQRDFIADASHELRTPLTMLRSSVEFVLRGRDHLRADDVALLEDTVLETTHLTSLANNMLNLARLDSDDVRIEEDLVELSELGVEVSRWSKALAAEQNITMKIEADTPTFVLGDRSLLEQAVLVLVDNGIKYNRPGGSVTIRVTTLGPDARLQVADNGIGVAAEHISRLSERFYRVDKARSRESGGAGLGLSIVRSIIARHNGNFRIESRLGEGTTATITLARIGGMISPS